MHTRAVTDQHVAVCSLALKLASRDNHVNKLRDLEPRLGLADGLCN